MIKSHIFKITWLFLILSLTLMVFSPLMSVSVYASSNVTTARYLATIRITNNSSSTAYNVSIPCTVNTTNLINSNYVYSNLTNSSMRDNLGIDTAYNPAVVTNTTWCFFAPIVPVGSIDYALYLGGASNMNGLLAYMAGTGGMTTTDNASLELGDNFSITLTGFIDTSAGNGKYLLHKPGAFAVNVTGAGNITASIPGTATTITASNIATGNHTLKMYGENGNYLKIDVDGINQASLGIPSVNQSQQSAVTNLRTGAYARVGDYIDALPAGIISDVSFYLKKGGSPTGNATATLRRVSDDAIIGTFGNLTVTSLTTSLAWYTFSNPVTNPTQQDARLLLEYSGGNVTNYISFGYNTTVLDGHTLTLYDTDYSNSNLDATIRYTGTGFNPIPNNANNYVFNTNSTMPYLSSESISVGGVTKQSIAYQNAAIFTDASGNGNNAIPTFRTTSSDASVSAVLLSFNAFNQAVVTNWTLTNYNSYVGDVPDEPGGATGMYEDTNPAFPGHDLPDEAADAGGVPRSVFWGFVPLMFVLLVGIFVHDKTKSLVAQATIIGVFMLVICLIHIWPLWVLVPFVLMSSAACLAGKVYGY